MKLLVLLLISFVPGGLWVWFFARNDRHPEPLSMLIRTFLIGTASVVPAALLERPLRPLLGMPTPFAFNIVLALLAIGFIEEGVKLLATYIAAFRSPQFDEVGDGIVYAITAALGFAAIENLFYTATYGLGVAVIRAVLTSLAHASFTGVFGFWLGAYRLGKVPVGGVWRGLALAAVLHALYDYVVMSRIVSPIFAVVLVYVVYRYVINKMRQLAVDHA